MKALDLFCGAGGASMGLYLAGFEVTGVDHREQPAYPFEFRAGDALSQKDLGFYDLVWASPPCQAFTAYRRRRGHVAPAPNLIEETRKLLRDSGVPYVIENVAGAPLKNPVMLCGSMFGLDVRRHRFFECSFPVLTPECDHQSQAPRFPPATNRTNLRRTVEVGVWRIPLETQRRAMEIDWMNLKELSQAIPPAYSLWIADQFKRQG
jgi:DNA (cytosine-5)-methyltransferase 1